MRLTEVKELVLAWQTKYLPLITEAQAEWYRKTGHFSTEPYTHDMDIEPKAEHMPATDQWQSMDTALFGDMPARAKTEIYTAPRGKGWLLTLEFVHDYRWYRLIHVHGKGSGLESGWMLFFRGDA